MPNPLLPGQHGEVVGQDRRATKPWYDFLRSLLSRVTSIEETAQAASDAVAAIPETHVPQLFPIAGQTVVYGSVDTDYQIGLDPAVLQSGGQTIVIREEHYNESWPIPGPAGATGATGPAGSGGSGSGQTIIVREETYEEAWPIPGQKGDTGAAGASGALALVGTATVAGAAATTLALSGLNLTADGLYFIKYSLGNNTASSANISLYYNADTTATNYFRVVTTTQSAGPPSGGNSNDAFVGGMSASQRVDGWGYIHMGRDSKPKAAFQTIRDAVSSAMIQQSWVHAWVTAANPTTITLSSSVANSLAIGSFFSVWKIN